MNWQIRLNQTTGSIDIIYGSCTATNSTSYTSQVRVARFQQLGLQQPRLHYKLERDYGW
ncbi:MAG: hypothetical protein IPL86_11795 [Flavobacteriales bacterium]|nr:hypothetical protein [Flavobacteriales bacterium]